MKGKYTLTITAKAVVEGDPTAKDLKQTVKSLKAGLVDNLQDDVILAISSENENFKIKLGPIKVEFDQA